MLTRRGFLRGVAGTFGASFLQRYERFVQAEEEPLIEAPLHVTQHYYASLEGNEWLLSAGEPREAPETPTWAEYFVQAYGAREGHRSDFLDLCEETGVHAESLDSKCDWELWFTYWNRKLSPHAQAFYELKSLNIGPILRGDHAEVGEISFIDGDWIANDYLGVHAADSLSLSLLQARLNQLETGIEIHLP